MSNMAPVHGHVDRDGRLIEAEPALAALHGRAGGEAGGVLAVPQLAAIARLARRLGITVSRAVTVADGVADLDLWVRAAPDGGGVRMAIAGWAAKPAATPAPATPLAREHDFLRASADWLWEADEALRVTALSSSAAAAVGESAARLLGQPLTRIFHLIENEEGMLPMLEALAGQRRFDEQLADLKGGGGRVRLSAVPLMDLAGRFRGFRGAVALVEPGEPPAERGPIAQDFDSDAFGQRLDRALRTPLDRIITTAESIRVRADGPLRNDYADYAADIAAAGRHLLALVDDLVDLQAIERPGFRLRDEAIDLADVARRAAGLLGLRAGQGSVRIDRPTSGEALPARGEYRRALQILVNLVGNAVRHSPPGGMVWLRGESSDTYVAITVADQGRGIALEDQARIFDKFEQVKPTPSESIGLGLYIARRLARAMGGDIVVESAPGQGARFTLTLPRG